MTSERNTTTSQATAGTQVEASGPEPLISRRALLRGASATVPTILTLQSGAALAASSNLLGTHELTGSQAEYGGTPCVNAASTVGVKGSQYDLGDPAVAEINVIPDKFEFRTEKNKGSSSVVLSPKDMCYKYQHPGPYYYHNGTDWVTVQVPQGGLTSAAALASFTGAPGVVIKNIANT